MKDGKARVCILCGNVEQRHIPANYSDGNLIGATVLVCPTAMFTPNPPPPIVVQARQKGTP